MSYGTAITMSAPHAEALARVRDELKTEGFGVLTEIDLTAAMKEKIGEEIEDYVILGACNPPLAFKALSGDRHIGLLLPCNVVVRSTEDGTVVEALDPQIMVQFSEAPELKEVADDAAARLARALERLAAG